MKIKINMTRKESLWNSDSSNSKLITLNKGVVINCISIEKYKGDYNHNQSVRLMKIILEDGRYFTLTENTGVYDKIS